MTNDSEENQSYLASLLKGSPAHNANVIGRTLQLYAVIQNDETSLLAFQHVAKQALENATYEEDKVIMAHTSSMLSGDLYDLIVISLEKRHNII
jgi:hypothetical protein